MNGFHRAVATGLVCLLGAGCGGKPDAMSAASHDPPVDATTGASHYGDGGSDASDPYAWQDPPASGRLFDPLAGSEPPTGGAMPRMTAAHGESAAMPASAAADDPAIKSFSTSAMPAPPPPGDSGSGAASTVVSSDAAYNSVEVFYATDRLPTQVVRRTWNVEGAWFRFPLIATIVAMLCYLFAERLVGRTAGNVLAALAGVAAAAGFVMAGIWCLAPSPVRTGVHYGNARGEMQYGLCEVTIPHRHRPGELETPSIFRLEFAPDPNKHIVFQGATVLPPDAYFELMSMRVADSEQNDALVFVHGFNVTFEDAVRRTAQIATDLKFDGAAICYSWPSQGGLLQYMVDETNVEWTVPHLKQFLLDVAGRTGARNISLVAHSMGNRALTSALRQLSYELTGAPPFREIVLTAPDIDADIFRRDLAPAIRRLGQRITLYASSNDEALILSKQMHGFPRAGDSGSGLVVVPGIDTIDVSSIDTSFIGHSYYGSNTSVLDDLFSLIREAKPVYQRHWLRSMTHQGLMYWVFDTSLARAAREPASR